MRYLFKLEELHEQSGNDVERGYTLQRISSHYNVSPSSLDPMLTCYPRLLKHQADALLALFG